MEQNSPMKLPKEWTDKIERDIENAARLQFHTLHISDQNTACRITYRNGAMAYAAWLYTCQMNYAALKNKYDNILATADGHSSQTENVWQSGFAAGHDVGTERAGNNYSKALTALRARCERMEDVLIQIQHSPVPANEWEYISWFITCKNIAGGMLSEIEADKFMIEQNVEKKVPKLTPEQIAQRKEAVEWYRNPGGKAAVWITGEYDRLYDQLKAEPDRKIVCWVDYEWRWKEADGTTTTEICRDICAIRGDQMEFSSRGHGYGGTMAIFKGEDEKTYFLQECERLHVQWLDEGKEAPNE
jgi:hypothetical protein